MCQRIGDCTGAMGEAPQDCVDSCIQDAPRSLRTCVLDIPCVPGPFFMELIACTSSYGGAPDCGAVCDHTLSCFGEHEPEIPAHAHLECIIQCDAERTRPQRECINDLACGESLEAFNGALDGCVAPVD